MKRRAIAFFGVTAAMAALLTATPPATAIASQASTAGVTSAVKTAQPTWTDCNDPNYPSLQCASIDVPLDHAHPDGEKITLALSRVPHTAETYQGPLLVNPGGPGGSGLWLAGYTAASLPKAVAAQYDVIGFDPRGVGSSEPSLNCVPGYSDPVRPASVPTTPAIEAANLKRAKGFADACGKKYGKYLPYISTVSTARDMDVIRQAVGAEKINYLGYSGGTYLGAVYAKLFPGHVRRAVLDSIVDPTTAWYKSNLSQDPGFDAHHKEFAAWVAKYDSTYKLGTDPAKVEATWYSVLAEAGRKPIGGKVGAVELENTFIIGGYWNGYWPYLAQALAAYVNDGDPDPLVKDYEDFAAVDPDDGGYSAYTAIECNDAPWPRDWNQWRADNWRTYAKAPFLTWNNAWYNAPCAFWPTQPQQPLDVANSQLPPVLLFQATGDAATPYSGAVKVHHLLRGSSLVVEQGGYNHSITLAGNQCLDDYLADYLATGNVPRATDGSEADAVCEKLPDPKPLSDAATSSAATDAQALSDTDEPSPSAPTGRGKSGMTLHGLLGFGS